MMTAAVTVGLAIGNRWGAKRGVLAAGAILQPLTVIIAMATYLGYRRYRPRPEVDVSAVARLTGIALRAGLTLTQALTHAAASVTAPTRGAVEDILRRAQPIGLGPALAGTRGPLGPFARRLASVHRTGASLALTIDGLERELLESRHAAAAARVRRLPVQLTIPLVLLILPGCVLLLMGPTVIDELTRVLDPFRVYP